MCVVITFIYNLFSHSSLRNALAQRFQNYNIKNKYFRTFSTGFNLYNYNVNKKFALFPVVFILCIYMINNEVYSCPNNLHLLIYPLRIACRKFPLSLCNKGDTLQRTGVRRAEAVWLQVEGGSGVEFILAHLLQIPTTELLRNA